MSERSPDDAQEHRFLNPDSLLPADRMTIVTRLTFRSGDREALESVVEEVKQTCRRKGVELRGPHSDSPDTYRVPMYRRLDGDSAARYPTWRYAVFQRRMELHGHEDVARSILEWEFPESVRVEAAFEQSKTLNK